MISVRAKEKLEALVNANTPGAGVRIEVRSGKAADELQKLVEELSASLLVIAANDLKKDRLGPVASRCVRNAGCDVLVLRDWQEGDFSKISVCTDFSVTSRRALERGIELSKINGACLEIVHVMYPPSLDPWGEALDHAMDATTSYSEECHAEVNHWMEGFLSPFASKLSEIRHEVVVLESNDSALALTGHFREVGTDLVILGTRKLSRIGGFFVGTNAENLLHDATVSVLAVRD